MKPQTLSALKAKARGRGRKTFTFPKPCPHDGCTLRRTNGGECVACRAARGRRDRARNKDKDRARLKAWRSANKQRLAAYSSQRRARERGAKVRITPKQEAKLRAEALSCAICGCWFSEGDRREIEHRRPLSRGGHHTRNNLQVTCSGCNRSKATQTQKEFNVGGGVARRIWKRSALHEALT